MNPTPDEELLSAYLDGETSPAECAHVEQWLAEDPGRRQALNELRGLGESLRALPRASLGEDLSERVLRRAEMVLLAAPAKVVAVVEPGPRPPSGPPPLTSFERWRRPAVWAGLALAAGLLIMVAGPLSKRMAPDFKLAAAPDASGSVSTESAVRNPLPQADRAAPSDATRDLAATDDAALGVESLADVPGEMRALDSAVDAPAAANFRAKHDVRLFHFTPTPLTNFYAEALGEEGQHLVVVELDVTSADVESDEFRTLLARNSIVFTDEPPRDGDAADLQRSADATELEAARRNSLALKQSAAAAAAVDLASSPAPESIDESASGAAPYQAVLVEASPEQIEGLLRDLHDRPAEFGRVAVEPAEGGEAERLSRFARSGDPAPFGARDGGALGRGGLGGEDAEGRALGRGAAVAIEPATPEAAEGQADEARAQQLSRPGAARTVELPAAPAGIDHDSFMATPKTRAAGEAAETESMQGEPPLRVESKAPRADEPPREPAVPPPPAPMPSDASPQADASPEEMAPEDGEPEDKSPEAGAPEEGAPEDSAPPLPPPADRSSAAAPDAAAPPAAISPPFDPAGQRDYAAENRPRMRVLFLLRRQPVEAAPLPAGPAPQ